jgi:hypothetical protein
LIAVTAIALIIPRSPVSQLMGSTDLLFAVCALVVVLVNERFTDRSRQAARRRQASGE